MKDQKHLKSTRSQKAQKQTVQPSRRIVLRSGVKAGMTGFNGM